jgi:hypothetical protein
LEAEAFAEDVLYWIATGKTYWDAETTVLTHYATILSERYWLPERYGVDYCRASIEKHLSDA